MLLPRLRLLPAVVGVLALVAACVEAPTTTPLATSALAPLASEGTPQLLKCSTTETQQTQAIVGPLGGIFALGRHTVNIPAGAVPTPTTFVLTVPAGQYMEVDVTALGVEHYVFDQPITVTIDYSRCGSLVSASTPLSVWYVAPVTHEPLEHMGGVVDRTAKTVTFTTGHLSGYAIAN